MNYILFIVFRYINPIKNIRYIQIIGSICLISIIICSFTMIVALSIFNGLEYLTQKLYKTFHPILKITPKNELPFQTSKSISNKINSIKGIKQIHDVLEENILIKYNGKFIVVKAKGIDLDYINNTSLNKYVKGKKINNQEFCYIGKGIVFRLNIDFFSQQYLNLYYPKQNIKSLLNNPDVFNNIKILPTGYFEIEPEVDYKYIITSLNLLQNLLNKKNIISSYDLILNKGYSSKTIKKNLLKILPEYKILDSNEQSKGLLDAIKLEKKLMSILLATVSIIACLNILFVICIYIITKNKDILILQFLGFKLNEIRRVFSLTGIVIGILGYLIGIFLGYIFCLFQMKFKFIKLGISNPEINFYPINFKIKDLWTCSISILPSIIFVSILPTFLIKGDKRELTK